MKDRLNILLMIACGGMMLSWFHSWDSFIMSAMSGAPVPVFEAALVLAISAMFTALHYSRGWRRIFIVLLHSTGFILSLSIVLYSKSNSPELFLDPAWISGLLNNLKGFPEWMQLITTVFFTVFLWSYGTRLAIIPNTKYCVNKRFDIGLVSFLILLLIKLTMRYKGFIPSYEHSTIPYFISFCMLGLLSMGLVRIKKTQSATSYYRGIGAVLSFILFVVFAGGLIMLFLPGLASGADTGYAILKTGARPVGRILVFLLRFIFTAGCNRSSVQDSSSSSGEDGPMMKAVGGEAGLFETILIWALVIIAGLFILAVLAALARIFFRWLLRLLLSKAPGAQEKGLMELILEFIADFKRMLLFIVSGIFKKSVKDKNEKYLYRRLLAWGSRSGLEHAPYETPKEYGSRLARFFPSCEEEIRIIVDMFNRSVYGCISPDDSQLSIAMHSWKKMCSPLLWPARIKSLLLSSDIDL